jgi:hypothetical protein
MTGEELNNIKFIKIEIERCERILNDLRHWQGTEEYVNLLRETKTRLISKKAEAENLINGIEDDELRLICKLKFIDLRSWNYIANKMHYDRSTVYKKYRKFAGGERVRKTNDNRCVCCGEIIPEGRQVCPSCEKGAVR